VVVIGLWLGIIGYGIAYAGVTKLGGGTCTLGQAFRGTCTAVTTTATATGASGNTALGQRQAVAARQAASVPTTPLAGSSSLLQP
jgi:hypothetical protein